MSEDRDRKYGEMTVEELEQRLRETFFYTDKIDDTVYLQLERLRTALEMKQPAAFDQTAEEFWERFRQEHGEEIDRVCAAAGNNAVPKSRRRRGVLRSVLIAAVLVVLLAGAALAAGPRLWVWVRGLSAAPVYNTPVGAEMSKQIAAALEELRITEPVYPSYLPDGFTLAEAYVSHDPLLLYELYTRGDRFLSITVTSVSASVMALYPSEELSSQKYEAGETAHYLFSNDGSITAVWYTENCFVSISGNIAIRLMKRIIDSVYA